MLSKARTPARRMTPLSPHATARRVLALAIASWSVAASSRADWELVAIDSGAIAAALALDADGAAHVCYFTPAGPHISGTSGTLLKYATNTGPLGVWLTQTVATLVDTGGACDIAVGTDGVVRILYVDGETLRGAYRAPAGWVVSTIVGGEIHGRCALALDSENNPHITFTRYRISSDGLARVLLSPFYARWADGAWRELPLMWLAGEPEYDFLAAEWQDLALDARDNVYGVWNRATTMMFMFPLSHDPNQLASIQPGLPGPACRFRLDANDHFYAAGVNATVGTIRLGRNLADPNDTSGPPSWWFRWNSWEVDNCGGHYFDALEPPDLGLAVGGAGNMHLAFYDEADGDLKYIWQAADAVDRVWPRFTELVDSEGVVGRSVDISVDGAGAPHVVYLDTTNRTVKYGKRHAFTGAQLRVSPSRWEWEWGYIDYDDNRVEVFVANPGTADLRITSISARDTSGGAAPPTPIWSVDLTDTARPLGALPATVPPGEFRTFVAVFAPAVISEREYGEVIVESNWGDVVIPLTGRGRSGEPPPPGYGCFIATAAYGTPLAEEVHVLRRFRDEVLWPHPAGRMLVQAYYDVSPPVARLIARHERLRATVRWGLTPVVRLVEKRFAESK